MPKIPHETIKEGDIVIHNEFQYYVKAIWNHGYREWWFDLLAVNELLIGTNYYKELMSVPSNECQLFNPKASS